MISVNTVDMSVRDLIVTVYAENAYHSDPILAGGFDLKWKTCVDKTPLSNGSFDTSTLELFNFAVSPV